MRHTHILAGCLLGTVLSACGQGDGGATTVSTLAQTTIEFSDSPSYALAQGFSATSNAAGRFCYSGSPNVFVEAAEDDDAPRLEITTDNAAQGVCLGSTSSGNTFVLVIDTDFQNNLSKIDSYVDLDSDGLPDMSSRQTVTTVSGHLVAPVLDSGTGTMYVIDGLSSTVLRFPDSTGDGIPDGVGSNFVAPGAIAGTGFSPRYLRSPTADSVNVLSFDGVRAPSDKWRDFSDTSGDGLADQVSVLSDTPLPPGFAGLQIVGEAVVSVKVPAGSTYDIDAVTDSQTVTLATFTGTGVIQTVALSRALLSGERLAITDPSTGAKIVYAEVVEADSTEFSGATPTLSSYTVGGSLEFSGVNITGLETVEAVRASAPGGTAWTTCSVVGYTSESLTITIPDLGLTKRSPVLFRISCPDQRAWTFTARVNTQ